MSDPIGGGMDSALENLGADAAAGLAGISSGPVDAACGNCGTPTTGDFCHVCGQSSQSLRRPFWSLVGDSIETLFAIDGRIARTLPDLVLFPGRMTREYLDGKRARYIPPFRLYFLSTLLFFVLMPLILGQGLTLGPKVITDFDKARDAVETSHDAGEMTDEEYKASLDKIDDAQQAWREGIPGLVSPTPPPADGSADAPSSPETEWEGFMPKEAMDSIRAAGENGDADAAKFARIVDNPSDLSEATMRWIPRLMFVMLPLYAVLLALCYLWRTEFLFFDHLIVSLHFHSALFVAMAVGALLTPLIGMGWVIFLLIIYSNWYLYRLNRVAYQRGWLTSALRTLTLDWVYFFILMSALLTAVILGALSL